MFKSCENCGPKLDCKAYLELFTVLTDPAFCGMIKDACERATARAKIYGAVAKECDHFKPEPEEIGQSSGFSDL